MNCLDVIFFQAELTPEKLAIVMPGAVIPYGRFVRGIISAQQRLEAAGVKPGQVIGLHVTNPVDHLVFACALYRMKVASATLTTANAYLQSVEFEAILVDNPAIFGRRPSARLIFVDISWFQDQVEIDVAQRSHARRDPDMRWVCRVVCMPDEPRPPIVVRTNAASFEAQVMEYWHTFGPDWERMISVMSLSTNGGLISALAALSLGRTVCISESELARDLIAVYKQHYLVASTQELASLLGRQASSFMAMPGLRGAYIEGTAFAPELVSECMATVSPNSTFAYTHPRVGTVACGGAAPIRRTLGAVGFVTPWVEVEILNPAGDPVQPEEEGKLRFRRRGLPDSMTEDLDGWIYPGQVARRLRNNLLVIRGTGQPLA